MCISGGFRENVYGQDVVTRVRQRCQLLSGRVFLTHSASLLNCIEINFKLHLADEYKNKIIVLYFKNSVY